MTVAALINMTNDEMIANSTVTERLLAYLCATAVEFEILRHEPARSSEEAARIRGTRLDHAAKSLVCYADDRTVLVVVPANLRVDARAFRHAFGVRSLRMVSPEQLEALTGLEPGAVPPFGVVLGLPTYADERLLNVARIVFSAGRRDTSVIMNTTDYVRLVQPTVGRFAAEKR